MDQQELRESIEEQTKDAINILQLLQVELSANEDDEHTIRTVSIVEKMLKSNLEIMQHLNQNCGNIQQSVSMLFSAYQSILQETTHLCYWYQYQEDNLRRFCTGQQV